MGYYKQGLIDYYTKRAKDKRARQWFKDFEVYKIKLATKFRDNLLKGLPTPEIEWRLPIYNFIVHTKRQTVFRRTYVNIMRPTLWYLAFEHEVARKRISRIQRFSPLAYLRGRMNYTIIWYT
jgi:hypothetical protein